VLAQATGKCARLQNKPACGVEWQCWPRQPRSAEHRGLLGSMWQRRQAGSPYLFACLTALGCRRQLICEAPRQGGSIVIRMLLHVAICTMAGLVGWRAGRHMGRGGVNWQALAGR